MPLGRIRTYSSEALRDYVKLYNPYKNTKGKQNPHKSYGYLIQPKLSQNIQWLGWPTGVIKLDQSAGGRS